MTTPLTALEAARLRRSLGARLSNEAKRRGVTADLIRKQYIFTVFLSRLFQDQAVPWVLLGGNALLIRTGGGRFTKDVDLAREEAWGTAEDARVELQRLVSRPYRGDPFEFDLYAADVYREPDRYGYGAETVKVKARALLHKQEFDAFTIDITIRRHHDVPVDLVPLQPIIDHVTLQSLPAVATAPVENHLADKVCALYELHGPSSTTASTRYRDLADIVRIISALPFEAPRLSTVLRREAARRHLHLPSRVMSPGDAWFTEFPTATADFAEYPARYRDLDAAIGFVGACLDGLLDGSRTSGTWDPGALAWRQSDTSQGEESDGH